MRPISPLPERERDLTLPRPLAVGGGGTTRAAVYALSSLGLSPLYLINRDPTETAAIISTPAFSRYDLRALEREDQWTEDEAERVACGVGAIPSFEPQTEGERNVYRVAEKVFASSGSRPGRKRPLVRLPLFLSLLGLVLQLMPSRFVQLEMAYKVRPFSLFFVDGASS